MWIKQTGTTREIYLRDRMEEPLDFGESGTAQVPQELGKFLVEHYPGIKEHSTQSASVETAEEEPEETEESEEPEEQPEVDNDG